MYTPHKNTRANRIPLHECTDTRKLPESAHTHEHPRKLPAALGTQNTHTTPRNTTRAPITQPDERDPTRPRTKPTHNHHRTGPGRHHTGIKNPTPQNPWVRNAHNKLYNGVMYDDNQSKRKRNKNMYTLAKIDNLGQDLYPGQSLGQIKTPS